MSAMSWHALSQHATDALPARPTQGQAIGGEEGDPGQEPENAEIDDSCPANGLIAVHPANDADDETAGNE
jgi:hypothetical protein